MSSQSSGIEKGGGGGGGEILHAESTTTIQHQPIDLAAHRGPSVVQLRPVRTFGGLSHGTITAGKTGVVGGTSAIITSGNNSGSGGQTIGSITATPSGNPTSIISVNRTGPNLTILPARGQPGGTNAAGQIPTYQIARGAIVSNVRSNLTTGHQQSITVTPISTSNFGTTNIRLTGPVNNGTWIQSGGNAPAAFSPIRTATITVSGRTVRPDGKMIHIPQSGSVQHVTQLQMVDNKGSILKPQLTAAPLMRGTLHAQGATNAGTPLTLAPFTIRNISATNIANLPTIQRPLGTSPNTANQVQKVITAPAHGPPFQILSTQKLPHAIQTITPIPRITCLTLSTHGSAAPNNTAPVVAVASRQGGASLIMSPSVSVGQVSTAGGGTTTSLPITKVYPVSRDGVELFTASQVSSASSTASTISLSTTGGTNIGPISQQQQQQQQTTTLTVNPLPFTAQAANIGGQTQLSNVVIAASSSNSSNTHHIITSGGVSHNVVGNTSNNTHLTHGHLVQVHGPITVNSSGSVVSASSGPSISTVTPGTMTQSYYHVDSKNLNLQNLHQHGRPIAIEKRTIVSGGGGSGDITGSNNKSLLSGPTVILTTTQQQQQNPQIQQQQQQSSTGHILHTVQNNNNNNTSSSASITTTNPNHITISQHGSGTTTFPQSHSISNLQLHHLQQQQQSATPTHVISSSQNFSGITSNISSVLSSNSGPTNSSSNLVPIINSGTPATSTGVIVTSSSSSSSSTTTIGGNTFHIQSSISSSSSSNSNNNGSVGDISNRVSTPPSSSVSPCPVSNNNNTVTTNTNNNNNTIISSNNLITTTGVTSTTTATMQTTTPAQSPSSQSQTKSTLSPRPSILRKREAAGGTDHHNHHNHTLSLPLRAQRNLALNFAIGNSNVHSSIASASSLAAANANKENATVISSSASSSSSTSTTISTATSNTTSSSLSLLSIPTSSNNNNNIIPSVNNNPSNNNIIIHHNNNITINSINNNLSSTRDSSNIHISNINSNNNNSAGINFINTNSLNTTNVPTVSIIPSNQSLSQCSGNSNNNNSSNNTVTQLSSLPQQTLVPGSSILKKEFLPPNEESSWHSCSSNSSGSTTISTTSETAEIQMQQQQQHHALPSSAPNGSHHHNASLLPTVTVTGLSDMSNNGSLSSHYGSLMSGRPINSGIGGASSSISISQNGIIRSATNTNSLRPSKALNKNNSERMKGRQDKDDGVSPRKKPRKQQLTTSDLFDSASEIAFYHGKRFKKSELMDPKMFEEFHERLNDDPATTVEEPQETGVFYYIKKPTMSLMQSNKCISKPPHNHFQRYCDVKSKDERRPTVNDLLNQKNVIQKANGWKLQHLNEQVEEVITREGEVVNQFSDLLNKLETKIGPNCTDRDLNRIMELLKGNIQRGKVIRDQMLESKSQVLKILEHKPRIEDVINKHNSKRPIKKRERL